jgi:hypothetical protein
LQDEIGKGQEIKIEGFVMIIEPINANAEASAAA